MRLLKLLLACVAVLCLISCKADKTRISDVVFTDSLAYVDGSPFSGELWSDDTTSYCLMAEEGRVVSLAMYHDNGQLALSMPSADSLLYYDVNGESIPFDTFVVRYKALAEQVPLLSRRIMPGKSEEASQ